MCGVFGIVSNEQVAHKIMLGLYDLQHRGEQGSKIVVSDGSYLREHGGEGLVTEIFRIFNTEERRELFKKLQGNLGIGHDLYSTIGSREDRVQPKTIQPLLGNFHGQDFALGLNGNLISLDELRREAEDGGYRFHSKGSDTEVIVGLLSVAPQEDIVEALRSILPKIEHKGAFALVILAKDKVIGVRDKFGIRPLCIGRDESSFILASESCAFNTQGAHFIREINPGELIVLGKNGIENSFLWAQDPKLTIDILEFVYFARPDSKIAGRSVYSYRKNAGELLAQEHPVDADVVIAVPESGRIYDLGFARSSGITLEQGLYKNRYFSRRTFLAPREVNRRGLQRLKLHPLREIVHEKRVVVTEDSIFRGNVSPEVAAMLREAGAREVHLRIGSAPIRFPDFVGIDIPSRVELIASSLSVEEVRKYIQADTLGYLSLGSMVEATGLPRENLYMACFTGEYVFETPNDL